MAHPRLLLWQLLFLVALVLNIALLSALASLWSSHACSTPTGPSSISRHSPTSHHHQQQSLPQPTLQIIKDPEVHTSRELPSNLSYGHRDCATEVHDDLTRYLCRVESSVVFYTPSRHPLVVAKDISFSRYYAQRDLQGWIIAYRNISFEVVEVSYRVSVSLSQLSVFLCLAIAAQDKHCMKPGSYHLLHQGQKVNQIHGLRDALWRKDGMCFMLREALLSYHGAHNFTFPCWVLPTDKASLQTAMRNSSRPYIVKPSAKGEGHGIFVVNTIEELDAHFTDGYVVQPLLTDPYLIQGKKFDFRTYVLVTSISPLRAYFYHDGLVRFASSKYNQSDARRGKETQVLTNTSIGKKYAHISNLTWTFQRLKHYLSGRGVDTERVFRSIHEATVRTLLSSEYRFLRDFRVSMGGYDCQHCHQLLGVDVILDSRLNPFVIEVNGLPSMQLSHELGAIPNPSSPYTATKFGLLHDMMQILYNTSQSVASQLGSELRRLRVGVKPGPLCDSRHHVFCVDFKDLQKLVESKREYLNRGDFVRIYPTADGDKYSKQILHMHKTVWKKFEASGVRQPPRTLWQTHRLYTALERLWAMDT